MNTTLRPKNFIIIAFLLSLLFHTSIIIYVIWQTTIHPILQKKHLLKNKNEYPEEWVKIKAHANIFGAPILFQDEPIDTSNIVPDIPNKFSDTQNNESIHQKTVEKENVSLKTAPESLLNENIQKQPQSQQKKHPLPKKKIRSKNYFIEQKKNLPQITTKPPLSLAQLTQGFLHHVKNEGTHTITMSGKKTGIPTDEQIKYERYLQKLTWCLQNSFNNHKHRLHPSITMHDIVYITLILNRDGSIKNCSLNKSSGNLSFDQFILFIFNDASKSFPPIPSYLKHDPFIIPYDVSLILLHR